MNINYINLQLFATGDTTVPAAMVKKAWASPLGRPP